MPPTPSETKMHRNKEVPIMQENNSHERLRARFRESVMPIANFLPLLGVGEILSVIFLRTVNHGGVCLGEGERA